MSDVGALQPEEIAFLEPYLPPSLSPNTCESLSGDADLPTVTLTYASSLDSMVALAQGARTTLSGQQSKRMTHYLRLRHDAILVGANTAVVDNPSLNCRYPGARSDDQPQPVVVDPNQRWEYNTAKVCSLAAKGQGKGPWIVVSQRPSRDDQVLLNIGGQHIEVKNTTSYSSGSAMVSEKPPIIAWREILKALKRKGVNSVMIEGGARVINTLLGLPELVSSVIITIAPTWLGQGGVEVRPPARTADGERVNSAWLASTSWRQFGDDAVLCGRISSKRS